MLHLYTGKIMPLLRSRIAVLCVLSLLGWLFPDALWSDGAYSVTGEDGEEITEDYDGMEIEALLQDGVQLHFESKLLNILLKD